MRQRWIGWALGGAVAAALCVGGMLASAPPAEAKDEALHKAAIHVLTTLQRNRKPLRVGITTKQAVLEAEGAASQLGDHYLPLEGSDYEPPGEWKGTIRFFVDLDEPETPLDELSVALLCKPYDKQALAQALIQAGAKLGLALEPDDEDPHVYVDYTAEGNSVSIALGDRLVYLENSL